MRVASTGGVIKDSLHPLPLSFAPAVPFDRLHQRCEKKGKGRENLRRRKLRCFSEIEEESGEALGEMG